MKNITISIVLLFIIHSYTVASERDITTADIVVSNVLFHKKDDLSWRDTKSLVAYDTCCIWGIKGTYPSLLHTCRPKYYDIMAESPWYKQRGRTVQLMEDEFIRFYRKIEN